MNKALVHTYSRWTVSGLYLLPLMLFINPEVLSISQCWPPFHTYLLIPVPPFRYYLAVLVQLLISHQFTLFIGSSIYYIQLLFSSSIEKKRARKCERLHVSRYIVQ